MSDDEDREASRSAASADLKARNPAWLHGWPMMGASVLMGSRLRCSGCGRSNGLATVAFPENWKPPGPHPEWPFTEDDCPIHR